MARTRASELSHELRRINTQLSKQYLLMLAPSSIG